MTKKMFGHQDSLDQCPHSKELHSHRWHGLPVKGCGGSHLSLEEAKRKAKPFEANDDKYVSKTSNFESLNLRYFWESILREHDSD